MEKHLNYTNRLLFFIFFSTAVLVYFIYTNQPKGDEADWYLDSFNQSYKLWPKLDLSPFWTISSFYLWVISGLHYFIGYFTNDDIILTGRFFSLICWLVLIYSAFLKYKKILPTLLFVFFNPYFLVYVTRAHPLVPAILLVFWFWVNFESKNRFWGIFLMFAVNLQVFTGGISAMLLPETIKGITKNRAILVFSAVAFAISGVIITWITWGGLYPENFLNHWFYEQFHAHGSLSFGYFPAIFMMAGSMLWFVGGVPLNQILENKKYNLIVVLGLIIGVITLYNLESNIGLVQLASNFRGFEMKFVWLSIYFIFGLGWLRVGRNALILFFGILSCGILLVVLPYFYERIAVFGTLAPCLIWVLMGSKRDKSITLNISMVVCAIFVLFASLYQKYGAL